MRVRMPRGRERPNTPPSAGEHAGTDQHARLLVAAAKAARRQADRHVDHGSRVRSGKEPPDAGGVAEPLPSAIIDFDSDPAVRKSVDADEGGHGGMIIALRGYLDSRASVQKENCTLKYSRSKWA